ncbi:MAG: histidine kinase, partial [Saprospiraceae bacterium]
PPNQYALKVKGENSDGVSSEQGRELRILIRPPFYKTTWFLVLTGLLLCGMVAAVIGERFRREQTKRKVAQLGLQALSTQLINHLFGNTMATLSNLIGQNSDAAKTYLLNLSSFLREILDNSRRITVRLEDEIELIRNYLKLEEHQFDPGKLAYELPDEDDIEPEGFKVPSLLLQPFVENAIVHGLRERGYGKVTVRIVRERDHVLCLVQDNGVGRGEKNSSKKRISHGIEIVRQHLGLYDREHGTRSSLEFIDLKDGAGLSTGTRVEIKIGIPKKRRNLLHSYF